ncbi:Transcriptional regulator, TetR family [Labilithrix luteola]|uniref:Transcriptional regulator, TetR family n=1 Tax=Labilithrix luteola TaxID=1391654 RepID=A0A0K1Q9F2_9BACT|nr:TetR/AcrR family transcriptional regulator [Labilithrix luteola]AKV02287.1 Transcriptional regulator, TetR family [Labilithrix luteola]
MARQRFEQLPRERQDEILDVAAAEFARSGYQGTSYNQLLERLGLGKGSAYYYFDNKRDLFLTVLRRCYGSFEEAMSALEQPRKAADYWLFVHRATVLSYERMLVDPIATNLIRCVQREKELLGELTSPDILSLIDGMYETTVRLGQTLGAIRTDMPLRLLTEMVRNMSAAFDAWFISERGGEANGPTPEHTADLYTDAVRRLCAPAVG